MREAVLVCSPTAMLVNSLCPKNQQGGLVLTDRALLMTMTGEPYQPARLHYRLFDKTKVTAAFAKLRCMDFDESRQRWVWLFAKEARKLKFAKSYSSIPWRNRPIVLGSFFSRTAKGMFLELNSFDRAIRAVEFFDQYLDRSIAEVTDIEIVNRFFGSPFPGEMPGHEYFDKKKVFQCDGTALLEEMMAKALAIEDPNERGAWGLSCLEKLYKEPLPEVERFPVLYYEEGIGSLEMSLKMRHIIAHQHWLGNTDYAFYDLLQRIAP